MTKKFLLILSIISLISLFACGCGDDGGTTIITTNPTVTVPTPGTTISTISGIVYNTDGSPFSGVSVSLTPNLESAESYGEVQTVTTGTDGRFSFTVSYGGTYFVEAKNGTTLLGSEEFTISLGSTVTLVLGMASTGTLNIQLTPSDAVASVILSGITASSAEITSAQSGAGKYIFYIPEGTYSFTVNAEGYNSVTRSATVTVGEETVENVDLTGEEIDIGTLTKIEPRVIVNQNLTTQEIKVTGSNFTGNGTDNNITITLVSSGGVNIPVSGITVDDPNTVRFTADFTGASSEEYILTITHSPITTSSSIGSSNIWLTDTIQNAIVKASSIYTSERAAGKITASASDPGWIEAYIPAGTYNPTPLNSKGTLALSSGVYLKGAGGDGSTGTHIIAAANNRHFYAERIFDVAIDGLRLTGGSPVGGGFPPSPEEGGVLYANEISKTWLITNSVMTGNSSPDKGGAVYMQGCEYQDAAVTIKNSTFTENTSSDSGGAIYINTYDYNTWNISVSGNVISRNNSTSDTGGGLRLYYNHTGGECIINDNTITDNYTNNNNGAGLFCYLISSEAPTSLYTSIRNNTITGNYAENEATSYGGGIYCYSGSGTQVDIMGNTIENNGNNYGGGIYAMGESGSTVNISANSIKDNAAGSLGAGGGIYVTASSIISSTTITGNEISGNGEAKTIGTESYNQTQDGGGIFASDGTRLYINKNNIYNNTSNNASGKELYYNTSPVLDATNNWWGTGVDPQVNTVVYNYTGGSVTVSPYAGNQFTLPVTP